MTVVAAAIDRHSAPSSKVGLFRSLFHGREDVYPRRFESRRTGKSGYAPACANEWVRGICEKPRIKCAVCPHRRFLPVTDEVIRWHLSGRDDQAQPRRRTTAKTSHGRVPPSRTRQEPRILGELPQALELVLGNQIYIAKKGLLPGLRNRLLRLAAFQNPEFYKAQAMRLSTSRRSLRPSNGSWQTLGPSNPTLPSVVLKGVPELLEPFRRSGERT